MTKRQEKIASKLDAAGIAFKFRNGDFFGDNGEFAEEITGIVVETEEDWIRAVAALGKDADAMHDELDDWDCWHSCYQEGFPIDVRVKTYEAGERGWRKSEPQDGRTGFSVV